jgi:hypothetical protein
MTRLLRRYLADPRDYYDFHDQHGEIIVRPDLLVWCCWEAWRRRVDLAEVLSEEVPEL